MLVAKVSLNDARRELVPLPQPSSIAPDGRGPPNDDGSDQRSPLSPQWPLPLVRMSICRSRPRSSPSRASLRRPATIASTALMAPTSPPPIGRLMLIGALTPTGTLTVTGPLSTLLVTVTVVVG